jgi:hypothetical protein
MPEVDELDSLEVATGEGRVSAEARRLIEARTARRALGLVIGLALWFGYAVVVPILWTRWGAVALTLVPIVGVYLFTWLAYDRHELWHGYFRRLDDPRWFDVVSWALLSDPQVYRAAHGWHHRFVHTPLDREFYCSQWTTNTLRRRAQFVAELFLGNIAWEAGAFWRLWKIEGTPAVRAALSGTAARLVLLGVVTTIGEVAAPGTGWRCLVVYGLTVWMGAVTTRQNQWIEHLGVFGDGSLAQRNALTRNLSSEGWAGWLFNVVNHHDASEHVFHHTEPGLDTRGAGLALPPAARTVTVIEYARSLVRYARSL